MAVLLQLSCPNCTPELACPTCLVPAACLSILVSPALPAMFWLSCLSLQSQLTVAWPSCHVLAVMFWPSWSFCLSSSDLSRLTFQANLFGLTCQNYPALAVLWWLYIPQKLEKGVFVSTLSVRYHCGGWPEEVNSCVLNSYMVYLCIT
jgi:hypothetical protein